MQNNRKRQAAFGFFSASKYSWKQWDDALPFISQSIYGIFFVFAISFYFSFRLTAFLRRSVLAHSNLKSQHFCYAPLTHPPLPRVAAEMISTNRTAFLPSSMSFNAWQPLLTRAAACLPQLTAGNKAGPWENNWKSVSGSAGKVKTITIEQSVTTPNERLNCNKLLQKKRMD